MDITLLIPYGRENAVTRAELSRLTGLPDRAVRDLIKRQVASGARILSSSGGRGYWMSDDVDEVAAFVEETRRRSKSTVLNVLPLERWVCSQKGIRTTQVRPHLRRLHRAAEVAGQISLDVMQT